MTLDDEDATDGSEGFRGFIVRAITPAKEGVASGISKLVRDAASENIGKQSADMKDSLFRPNRSRGAALSMSCVLL